MASTASMVAVAENPWLVARAEEAVVAAAEYLGVAPPTLTPAALGHQLASLRQRLEDLTAQPTGSAEDRAAASQILIAILKLQCDLLDEDLARRVRSMSEIRNALSQLRGLAPSDMIRVAGDVLSRELAFARTMVSAVCGSLWVPRYVHIEDRDADPHARSLQDFVATRRIQLADAPLETELVRKRCGVFAPTPQNDKRVFREIMEASGCFGYIGAPIIVQGRVIGILHADRPEPHGIVTMDHLEQLEAFAECLSVAYESAALEGKAAQQRLEVENLWANADRRHPAPVRVAKQLSPTCHRAAAVPLTAREHEIMSHVATGATNSQIARYLVISEGTVKSHLKHIAKKLNTTSRAAAVAAYAGVASADLRAGR